jgi:hypothetical protein
MVLHWEKQCPFWLSANSNAAWVNLEKKQVSITHHVWLPYPDPGNIIQCSPWADWIPATKLKNIKSEL